MMAWKLRTEDEHCAAEDSILSILDDGPDVHDGLQGKGSEVK